MATPFLLKKDKKTKRKKNILERGAKMTEKELILILEKRFKENMNRHIDVKWDTVLKRLNENILLSLKYMEQTGGEPDIVIYDKKSEIYSYCDCSKESPIYRRNLCYDNEALNKRKNNKPVSSAIFEAEKHNIKLLTEEEYKHLQTLGDFDLKSSSWLLTEKETRLLGGAIFGDKRYNNYLFVFSMAF